MNLKTHSYFDRVAQHFTGFEAREGQLKMYHDILTAYEEEKTYLIEAGTGTGKSLAYLIPALQWALEKGEPTVIATHTIALQEQLMQKDIPFLLQALDLDLKAVLVKGMSNYVCLRKLHDSKEEVPESLFAWAKTTVEGSRSELPIIPSHELWENISAEAESCTHVKCPHYKDCFFFKARKEAADAHLIVANHHLFFADLSLREQNDSFDEAAVLPAYTRVILDEAHHCEDVATNYFAKSVSRRGLIHSLGRLISDRGTGKVAALYRKICEAYPSETLFSELLTLILPVEKRKIVESIHALFDLLAQFCAAQKKEDKLRIRTEHLQDHFWIETIQPGVEDLVREGKLFLQSLLLIGGKLKEYGDPVLDQKCEGVLAEINGICGRLEGALDTLHAFAFTPLEPEKVRWVEGVPPDLHLISADLEVAPRLAPSLFERCATIVLCSATLAADGEFSFIRKRLGIEEAEERCYPSPFDFKSQALLSVPTDIPDPSHPSFTKEAAAYIWEAIEASKGGAFVLFTSYSMLRECERILKDRMYQKKYALFCQGDENRSSLLRKFRNTERAVLFGTDSFWEGVDVAGEALRCVIIVKLPFKVPNDPLFEARSEAIASQGGSPFAEYSLPSAIVKFKQGFGRLIRNSEDRGCIVCLDSRLVKKGYGKKFLKSLPECPTVFDSQTKCVESLKTFYYNNSYAFNTPEFPPPKDTGLGNTP